MIRLVRLHVYGPFPSGFESRLWTAQLPPIALRRRTKLIAKFKTSLKFSVEKRFCRKKILLTAECHCCLHALAEGHRGANNKNPKDRRCDIGLSELITA